MRSDGCDHRDDVNIRCIEDLIFVRGIGDPRMCLAQSLLALGIPVTDENNFRAVVRVKIPNDVRTPITITNYTNANHGTPYEFERTTIRLGAASISRDPYP